MKLALLKKVSFNVTDENIQLYLSDKVSFHKFDGTLNLFHKINELLGNNMLEVINCYYDEQYLIQAFYIENTSTDVHENIVFVKRLILEQDSYTYIGVTPETLQKSDQFVYTDIQICDIEVILRKKYANDGVMVGDDGSIIDVSYTTTYDKDNHTGTLTTKINNETNVLKYINVSALVNKNEGSILSSEQFAEMLEKKIEDEKCNCFYLQKDFKMGLLNCYSPIVGNVKNEILSKLIGDQMYGNIMVGLENHLNDDNRILSLNSSVFKKIINLCSCTDENFKPKNELFCNIFYEISHM